MNSDATFYVQSCQGPNIPEIVLRSVNENHKVKFIFELNERLEEDLQGKAVSERLDLTVSVQNYSVPVLMKLPKGYQVRKNNTVNISMIKTVLSCASCF